MFGPYQLDRVVGRGSSGRVVRVVDTRTGEPRALKLVATAPGLLHDELAALARVDHPAIPHIHDVGRLADALVLDGVTFPAHAPYFVASWIDGAPLTTVAGADVWRVLADVTGALAAIHAVGLVHGDVAPHNVLATPARASLVDLGLARPTGARGTPIVMAPEAFGGIVEPRSDLYALGATIARAVDGPGPALSIAELARRAATGDLRPALRGLPPPLVDLLHRLLARSLDARPASALAVLDELDQIAPALDATATSRKPRARTIGVPSPATWPRGEPTIAAITATLDAHGVAIVAGDAGSGARELAQVAVARWRLARLARGEDPVAIEPVTTLPAGIVEARALRAGPALPFLELGADPRAPAWLAMLARIPGPLPAIAIVDAPIPGAIEVPRLAPEELAQLATQMRGSAPPKPWLAQLAAATQGRIVDAIDVLRRPELGASPAARISPARVVALSERARRLALAVVAWGGRCRIDRALATAEAGLAELAELERQGLGRRAGDDVIVERAVAAGHDAELARLAERGLAITADPALYEFAPLVARSAAALDAADAHLARGAPDRALAIAGRLPSDPRALLIRARAHAARGAYAEATACAAAARTAGADPIAVRLAIARVAQRAGDLDRAEPMLAELAREAPDDAEVAGAYARLLVTRGRYAEARTIALAPRAPLAGLRAEAAGLAALYTGALDDADRAFAVLELGAMGSGIAQGRALSLRGMVAQQRGQLAIAGERYAEAARLLASAGELHAAATAHVNLGTVLAERGRASDALPHLADAARVFAEVGATTELCAAELARANALLATHDLDAARAAADRALAGATGVPHLRTFARLVAADVRRAQGDRVAAERGYREALAGAGDDPAARLAAWLALVETGLDPGVPDATIEATITTDDDRDRWVLARARRARLRGEPVATEELLAVGTRAERGDRLDRAFRAFALAGATDRARAAHAAIVAAAAPAFRARLAADPDLPPAPPTSEVSQRLAHYDPALLRRLLHLSRKLNSEESVARILDEVIDTAIELASAERGFLLLRQGDELAISVMRGSPDDVSRSIAERAATTGEPVITVDAGLDERFETAASVAALRLRSVLAVPLRQRGVVIGCLYVDHRLHAGAFDPSLAMILGELADIAAVAIENARLTDELRATTTRLDALTSSLATELADRDAELARTRALVGDRLERYTTIAGRSPAMIRMLGVVDRAAATSLPVVVVGESGTGKELVARALHDHGPRAAGPFVAINCGALPEQLLESELFGHVRGAFTGADRDRRGMFEVADGGTLFLDEIADTSAAMQAKLLRVLQDGIVRRVGETTKQKRVDVRVVVATQRSLAELVTAGRFREDLRYRLEVIAINVPPLREREGDLPLLVEALLARIAAPPPRLTRPALRALAAHRWPGNVRELENALARGVAMGGDVIDLGDLPETIVALSHAPPAARVAPPEDLRLKPALATTEQAYITAAMERAKNNQTVAARLLGLSRFGLQKKLRRIAGDADADANDD